MKPQLQYIQVLIKNRGRYQLCWIPTLYAVKGKRINIRGDYAGPWQVLEVYDSPHEVIDENGKVCDVELDKQNKKQRKVIWNVKVEPILQGDKMRERLNQYRKMKRLANIEEVEWTQPK